MAKSNSIFSRINNAVGGIPGWVTLILGLALISSGIFALLTAGEIIGATSGASLLTSLALGATQMYILGSVAILCGLGVMSAPKLYDRIHTPYLVKITEEMQLDLKQASRDDLENSMISARQQSARDAQREAQREAEETPEESQEAQRETDPLLQTNEFEASSEATVETSTAEVKNVLGYQPTLFQNSQSGLDVTSATLDNDGSQHTPGFGAAK